MTNEEINALTDAQINVMMTRHLCNLHDGFKLKEGHEYSILEFDNGSDYMSAAVYDYCNDPAVMMPIVFENGVALSPARQTDGEITWTAGYFMGRVVTKFTHANPLRAAAIVYLKMKGVL